MTRSRSTIISLLAVALCLPLPMSAGQGNVLIDVSVTRVTVDNATVVNVSDVVHAIVRSTAPTQATVTFTWGDGVGLSNPTSPGGNDYTVLTPIPAAGDYDIFIEFTPSFQRAGNQTIVATAVAQGDADRSNDRASLVTFVADPRLTFDIEQPGTMDHVAGLTTVIRYRVNNTGNHDDVPQTSFPDIKGWELRDLGIFQPIPPGSNATGRILATPTTGDPNLTLDGALTVASQIDPAVHQTAPLPSLKPTTTANGSVELALVGSPDAVQVAPGETMLWNLTVANRGTLLAVAWINATLPPDASGWSVTPDAASFGLDGGQLPLALNGSLPVELAPAQERRVQLNITRNATGSNASLVATIHAEVGHAAGKPSAFSAATRALALLSPSPDPAVVAIETPPVLYQGDPLVVGLRLEDRGRLDANGSVLHVELRDDLGIVSQETLNYSTLPARSNRTLTWTIGTEGLRGDYAVSTTLVPNGSDADATNNAASAFIHVRRAALQVSAPIEIHAIPGERIALRTSLNGFAVHDTGDDPETIDVDLSSNVSWIGTHWVVRAEAAGMRIVPVEIQVPDEPGVAEVVANFSARLVNRTSTTAWTTVRFLIDDDAPPQATLVAPKEVGHVHERTVVIVDARDATGIQEVALIVTSPTGARETHVLEPDAGARYRGELVPTESGTYQLEIRAEDASPSRNQFNGPSVAWTVEAPAFKGLLPVGFEEGSAVSSRNLGFREASEGTVARATIDVGQGKEPLRFPFNITLPLLEGSYTLRLAAVSFDSASWTATWNVTLDQTPPRLANASVESSPDGQLKVRVEAVGARNVTARLAGSTGSHDVPIPRLDATHFGGQLPAPVGFQNVVFLARDEAGNEASLPASLATHPTPLPALGVLGALLVAALLGGRRRAR